MSVSLSVSSVLCLSHSYALCSLHTCSNIYLSVLCPTHFFVCVLFKLYFFYFCIHMSLYHAYNYLPIYLSVTFIHTMPPVCVCLSVCLSVSLSLSLSLTPHLPLFFLRHYVGIACVQLCSSVCHTHVIYLFPH